MNPIGAVGNRAYRWGIVANRAIPHVRGWKPRLPVGHCFKPRLPKTR